RSVVLRSRLFHLLRHPPYPPRFPYAPLFRSVPAAEVAVLGVERAPEVAGEVGAQLPDRRAEVGVLPEPYAVDVDRHRPAVEDDVDRKSTRLNSSHVKSSYAVFCLKKKKKYRS